MGRGFRITWKAWRAHRIAKRATAHFTIAKGLYDAALRLKVEIAAAAPSSAAEEGRRPVTIAGRTYPAARLTAEIRSY